MAEAVSRGLTQLPVPSHLQSTDLSETLLNMEEYFEVLSKYVHRVMPETTTRFVMSIANPPADYYHSNERELYVTQNDLVRCWNADYGFPEDFYFDFFNMADELGPTDSARIMSHFFMVHNDPERSTPPYRGAKNAVGLLLARGVFYQRREALKDYLKSSRQTMDRSFSSENTKSALAFYGFDHFLEGISVALGLQDREIRLERPSIIYFPADLLTGLNKSDYMAFLSLISTTLPMTSIKRYNQWVEALCLTYYCEFPPRTDIKIDAAVSSTKLTSSQAALSSDAIAKLLIAPRPTSGVEDSNILELYKIVLSLAACYGSDRLFRFNLLDHTKSNGFDEALRITGETPHLLPALLHPVVMHVLMDKTCSLLCEYLYRLSHYIEIDPALSAYMASRIPPLILPKRVTRSQLVAFYTGSKSILKGVDDAQSRWSSMEELCKKYKLGQVVEVNEDLYVYGHPHLTAAREFLYSMMANRVQPGIHENVMGADRSPGSLRTKAFNEDDLLLNH